MTVILVTPAQLAQWNRELIELPLEIQRNMGLDSVVPSASCACGGKMSGHQDEDMRTWTIHQQKVEQLRRWVQHATCVEPTTHEDFVEGLGQTVSVKLRYERNKRCEPRMHIFQIGGFNTTDPTVTPAIRSYDTPLAVVIRGLRRRQRSEPFQTPHGDTMTAVVHNIWLKPPRKELFGFDPTESCQHELAF